MPLPRFRLRAFLIAVPVAGLVLALTMVAAGPIGSVGQLLGLLLVLSIAWVPAVCLLLSPRIVGWLFVVAASASVALLAYSLYAAAHGGPGWDSGPAGGVTLWLSIAFGIGYVATKGLHLPDRRRAPDIRPEADAQAER